MLLYLVQSVELTGNQARNHNYEFENRSTCQAGT